MKIGDIVMVQGYEFRATKVWWSPEAGNWRFIGECTPNPRNDYIRGSGYDRAEYSHQGNKSR